MSSLLKPANPITGFFMLVREMGIRKWNDPEINHPTGGFVGENAGFITERPVPVSTFYKGSVGSVSSDSPGQAPLHLKKSRTHPRNIPPEDTHFELGSTR